MAVASRLAALLAALAPLAACAVNGTGLVAARVFEADGARVVAAYGVGADLRTAGDAPGLRLGVHRRVTVHPLEPGGPRPGWHYLRVPRPAEPALAVDSRALGVMLDLGPPTRALTIGYSAETVLARVAAGESEAFALRYRSDDPRATVLTLCRENPTCPEP